MSLVSWVLRCGNLQRLDAPLRAVNFTRQRTTRHRIYFILSARYLQLAPPLSVSSCLLCCFISSVFNKRVLETSRPDVTYLPRLLRPLSFMQIVDPSSDERTQNRVSAGAGLPQAEPLMMMCVDARGASWYGRHGASSLKAMPGPLQ